MKLFILTVRNRAKLRGFEVQQVMAFTRDQAFACARGEVIGWWCTDDLDCKVTP